METWKELDIKVQIEQVITEREGMIAENKQREITGESMAYAANDFNSLCKVLDYLRQEIRNNS